MYLCERVHALEGSLSKILYVTFFIGRTFSLNSINLCFATLTYYPIFFGRTFICLRPRLSVNPLAGNPVSLPSPSAREKDEKRRKSFFPKCMKSLKSGKISLALDKRPKQILKGYIRVGRSRNVYLSRMSKIMR